MNGKAKSTRRFEALHHLIQVIVPTLPGSTHAHVLTAAWIYAKTTDNNVQQFDATKSQLAESTNLHPRTVQKCLMDLESGGVILTTKIGSGNRGSVRIITGHPYQRGGGSSPQAKQRGGGESQRGGPDCSLSETEQTNGVVSLKRTPPKEDKHHAGRKPRRVKARTKGVRGYKNVMRGTKYGNPFSMAEYGRDGCLQKYRNWLLTTDEGKKVVASAKQELRGYDLGCTCPLNEKCHADILLCIANDQPLIDS